MANQITGIIVKVGDMQVFPSKNGGTDFRKRELILDTSRYDTFTGEKRENYATMDFIGRNADELTDYKAGDLVTVSFILQGRKYDREGVVSYFTNVVGYKIDRVRAEQNQQIQTAQVAQSQPQEAAQAKPDNNNNEDLPF